MPFYEKKMYLILLVVSFSSLFSSILYADTIYCLNDSQCPEGMHCIVPEFVCEVATIVCTEYYEKWVELKCYTENEFNYDPYEYFDRTKFYCIWTGMLLDSCLDPT